MRKTNYKILVFTLKKKTFRFWIPEMKSGNNFQLKKYTFIKLIKLM